jgi:hypothetical protein
VTEIAPKSARRIRRVRNPDCLHAMFPVLSIRKISTSDGTSSRKNDGSKTGFNRVIRLATNSWPLLSTKLEQAEKAHLHRHKAAGKPKEKALNPTVRP